MAVPVASHIATFLAGPAPVVKVSEIGRRRTHDRSIEIYHRPIRSRIASYHAVRIVACHAAEVIVVVTVDVAQVRQVVALVAQGFS